MTLIWEAKFEERDGTLEFVFDEDLNIESLTVNAEYSTIEILQKAGLNTVLGMGTVFVVLIFLSFVIWLLKFIPVLEKKFRKNRAEETQAEVQTEAAYAAAEEEDVTDDAELAAVIAAAVAAAEGTSADSFIVRSIKRRKSNKWNSPGGWNMKSYTITVNGKVYDVTVEEKSAGSAPAAYVPAPAAAPKAAPASAPAAPAAPAAPKAGVGKIQVKAGAAGKVYQIPTSVGQSVQPGDAVIIIEAMKMEIPVVAPEAGTIASIDVQVGDAVEAGAVLATLN